MVPVYENFKRNLEINPNISFDIVRWKVSPQEIDIVKTYVDTLVVANPYADY